MKRSNGRILTTHAGRLSGPPELIEVTRAIQSGRSSDIEGAMPLVRESMAGVIRQQVEAGIDVVSDGELGKVGFGLTYYSKRLTGLNTRPVKPGEAPTMSAGTAERQEFADFYKELGNFGVAPAGGAVPNRVIVDGRGHPVTLYTHARDAVIEVGDGVFLNGTRMGCAQRIAIGARCILGDARIADTDYHGIHPEDRRTASAIRSAAVVIGENVWLGMAVLVLKGVTVGRNSLVGAGAVVTTAIPENCIAAGNPAKVVSHFAARPSAAAANSGR